MPDVLEDILIYGHMVAELDDEPLDEPLAEAVDEPLT
jgi:hypothetical protein